MAASEATPLMSPRSHSWLRLVQWTFGAAALLGILRFIAQAPMDWGTAALVGAGLTLFACLRALFRVVFALARPEIDAVVEQESDLGMTPNRQLREEKRRLLQALKELRFDFEMGKLSQKDYDAVRETYELRAVEVMRQLERGDQVHPELLKRIDKVAGPVAKKRKSSAGAAGKAGTAAVEAQGVDAQGAARRATDDGAASSEAVPTIPCPECGGSNDGDARFCKHCGKAITQ